MLAPEEERPTACLWVVLPGGQSEQPQGAAHRPRGNLHGALQLWGCAHLGFPTSKAAARIFWHPSHSIKATTKLWLTLPRPSSSRGEKMGAPGQPQGAQSTERQEGQKQSSIPPQGKAWKVFFLPLSTPKHHFPGQVRPLGPLRSCSLSGHCTLQIHISRQSDAKVPATGPHRTPSTCPRLHDGQPGSPGLGQPTLPLRRALHHYLTIGELTALT